MSSHPLSARERLIQSHTKLASICDSINTFTPSEHVYQPPIIDNHETRYTPQELPGLPKFRSICEKECMFLEELSRADDPPEHPSTNAPYLVSVWEEVLSCPRPLVGIGETFRSPRGERVKVDVIGKGGMLWVKVNTIKLSRLLLEFREQDSYINSDYDSSDAEDPVIAAQTSAYPISPINSVTKQGYDLVQTASRHRTPWGTSPMITLRLTRMSGAETQDPRIGETYDCLRRMGITLLFGETPESTSTTPRKPARLLATPKLNLDLSLLIALISDISHAPLPTDETAAEQRFTPLDKTWKRHISPSGEVTVKRLSEGEAGPEEHSKALTYQLKQEMRLGLVDELNATISESCRVFGVSVEEVEFWTTSEARKRCRDIVAKIGGEQERQREERLFDGPGDFWHGSRHTDAGKPLNRFLRVQILPEDDDAKPTYNPHPRSDTFRGRLIETCDRLLSVPIEKGASVTADFLGLTLADSPATSDADSINQSKPRPHRGGQRRRQPLADTFLRVPTAHTIRSMLQGARRGMTTVTANRMSVKQILRAMGPLEALEDDENVVGQTEEGDREAMFYVMEPKTLGELKRGDIPAAEESTDGPNGLGHEKGEAAKFWVFEPRSLGEEVRSNGE